MFAVVSGFLLVLFYFFTFESNLILPESLFIIVSLLYIFPANSINRNLGLCIICIIR
jgi:hypothetical protein